MNLTISRLTVVAILCGLVFGLFPPSFTGAAPQAAAATSEVRWSWSITGRAADARIIGDSEYTSTRTIDINGTATVREDEAGTITAAPFTLEVTDLSEGTELSPCPNAGTETRTERREITDPRRYQGGPDQILAHPEFAAPLVRSDGSRYLPNPFAGAFYSSGEVTRDFTYQHTTRRSGCGTPQEFISQFEGVRYRITDFRTVDDLTPGVDPTRFFWEGTYTIVEQDIFQHDVPITVSVRVDAHWIGSSSVPSPTPSPSPSPTPSPICVPVGTRVLTVETSGAGTVAPGSGEYLHCEVVTLTATPAAGQLFLGWTIDGIVAGHANPLSLTLNRNRVVAARFTAAPVFTDVTSQTPYAAAITELAARGIIRGYGDGRFGPADGTLRAQMAALIVRAMGWDGEDWGNPFSDQGEVDADLWRNVGTLAHYDVARGYGDGTYDPAAPVLNAQAVSFVTRAMVARGYWQAQADNPALYPNVPAASGHREDIATFVHYAGALPGTASATGEWSWYSQPATRSWFSALLWTAIDAQFGVDRTP